MESCKLFLERARKRVERALAVVDRVQEQKALYEAEVVEGEARYAKLLAVAAIVDALPVVSPQVTELQERINALVLERQCHGPHCRCRQRSISGVGWCGLGGSFRKETISNEVGPQVLARSVQNRVENRIDGVVRRH